VVRRHELTDAEWELIEPLLPRPATNRPRVDDRRVLNGIIFKIRTGVAWRDLPDRYGPWQTCATRSAVGPPTAPSPTCSPRSRPGRTRPGWWTGWWPSTPPSCGPTRARPELAGKGDPGRDEPDDHALGWSRGGLTTKIHLACDGTGRPLAVVLTGGNRNDHTAFQAVLAPSGCLGWGRDVPARARTT